jgi:hypothetical protein
MDKDKIRDQLRVMAIAAYFSAAAEINAEPQTVMCDVCKQMTGYSVKLESTNPLDKMCLSDQCMDAAMVRAAA